MHGRLKVKTTAEQEEAKRIEKQKKLKEYTAGTERVFEKRRANEYDDESLMVSSKLLLANPDFYTLWNFRKEIILHMSKEKNDGDDMQQVLENELFLVEECLRKNPKSYGAWCHRAWSIGLMPCPNWNREIHLCYRLLELDERNFHCWDYRRFVCQKALVKPSDELNFTTKKIETNFSNYSAWHYRSCLLPIVYPGKTKGAVIEEKLLEEYELVQNATFTDPNDQSVWFYHRWLLGRGEKPLQLDVLYCSRSSKMIIIKLSKPVLLDDIADNLRIAVKEKDVNVHWDKPASLMYASSIWFCTFPLDSEFGDNDITIIASLSISGVKDQLICVLSSLENEKWTHRKCNKSSTFRDEQSATTAAVLERELESCRQLQEFEPENKWNLFTIVLLMQALHNPQYDATIFKCLDQLVTIDPKRKNYFLDLKSRFLLQNIIEQEDLTNEISLTDKELTSLHHMDYFVLTKRMDLSRNLLKSGNPLCHLLRVKDLKLDNNQISSCYGLGNLLSLEILSLENNNITSVEGLSDLTSCPKLCRLSITGNPITKDEDHKQKISQLLPSLAVLL